MSIPIIQEKPTFGAELSRALGGGFSEGLQSSLQQFQEKKRKTSSATQLVDSLGLSGEKKNQAIGLLSSIPAEKQPAAIKAISESQINQQALNLMGSPAVGEEEFKENIDETPGGDDVITIENVDWEKNELPPKSKQFPAIGPLADQAKLQQKQNQFNQERNLKFSEGYEDLTKLQENVDNVNEAIKIIDEENLGGKARQFIKAIATQKNPNLDELIKTDAENKLYHLLYDFIRPKELGGSNPSTREVIMSLARLPSGAKGKEVSKFIAKNMQNHADKMLTKGKRINSLLSYDPYMNPGKFRSLADKPLKSETSSQQRSPKKRFKRGDQIIEISEDLFEKAQSEGFEPL